MATIAGSVLIHESMVKPILPWHVAFNSAGLAEGAKSMSLTKQLSIGTARDKWALSRRVGVVFRYRRYNTTLI